MSKRRLYPLKELWTEAVDEFISTHGSDTNINILTGVEYLSVANQLAESYNKTKNINITTYYSHDYPASGWAIANNKGVFVSHEEIK